jgi:hypothetical protein
LAARQAGVCSYPRIHVCGGIALGMQPFGRVLTTAPSMQLSMQPFGRVLTTALGMQPFGRVPEGLCTLRERGDAPRGMLDRTKRSY